MSSSSVILSTQHEYVLFSPQALSYRPPLPGMSGRGDILQWFPPNFHSEYSDSWLRPDHIGLFIFQILALKPDRKLPIELLPHHDPLSAQR
jgi:hypothetical protein